MTSGPEQPSPYRGVQSYTGADGELFFGRETESRRLADRVRGPDWYSDWSLLHAVSGAGKSSLLAARVVPDLERLGLSVAVATPGNIDPLGALEEAVLDSLFPAPDRELTAIACLGDDAVAVSLTEARDAFEARVPDVVERRKALFELLDADKAATHPPAASLPMFGRLLRGSLSARQLLEHLKATTNRPLRLTPESSVREVRSLIEDTAFRENQERLRRWIAGEDDPARSREGRRPPEWLLRFLGRLIDYYGAGRGGFSLLLVLDQFEELFTNFPAPDPVEQALREDRKAAGATRGDSDEAEDTGPRVGDWNRRQELVAALAAVADALAGQERARLPVRFLFSLRSEFVGELEPIRAFAPRLGSSATGLKLDLLSPEGTRAAIREPAALAEYTITETQVDTILEALERGDEVIEPIHLQIVCERLWRRERRPPRPGEERGDLVPRPLEVDEIRRWISEYFLDYLLLELEPGDREESVEMLTELVTLDGYRRPVAEQDLLAHLTPLRKRLLEELVRHGWVRRAAVAEYRYVVIEHEWMARLVRRAAEELKLDEFREAAKCLREERPLSEIEPLTAGQLRTLLRQRIRVSGEVEISEFLLRSALLADWDAPADEGGTAGLKEVVAWVEGRLESVEEQDDRHLERWKRKHLRNTPEVARARHGRIGRLRKVLSRPVGVRPTAIELSVLGELRPFLKVETIETERIADILRGQILVAGPEDQAEVEFWAWTWGERVLGEAAEDRPGPRSDTPPREPA